MFPECAKDSYIEKMLPKPSSSFTIPSIHDDKELECRLYHPSKSTFGSGNHPRRGAILAHPYAPLGGCIDDPVLQVVGEAILKQGYVLGLFNFRGAGASKGRTSWNGKPEQADYISFVGFLVSYLSGLSAGESLVSPGPSPALYPTNNELHYPSSVASKPQIDEPITLILGGYSYGSLIASQLPDIENLMSIFSHAAKGSAAAEIRLRADHLSRERNNEADHTRQRGQTLTVEDALACSSYGGEECEPGTRRTSRESRRSMDAVRKSVEASRARLHLKRQNSEGKSRSPGPKEDLAPLDIPQLHICFLLISPVLPPVASFLTVFSKPWKAPGSAISVMAQEEYNKQKFERNQTFAVFGDHDFFTSSKKLRKWGTGLASQPDSRFTYREVTGAGHFWQEDGVEADLHRAITEWIQSLGFSEGTG